MDILIIPIIIVPTTFLLYQCWKKEKEAIFFITLLFAFMLLGAWSPVLIDSCKEVLVPDGGNTTHVLIGLFSGAFLAAILHKFLKLKLFNRDKTH